MIAKTTKSYFAQNLLADVQAAADIAKTAPLQAAEKPNTPIGAHMQMQTELDSLRKQVQDLKQQSESGAGGALLLDPKEVKQSEFANRSEHAYLTPDFIELKTRISQTGGNVQAGCVYKDAKGQWRIVFGRRRLRACRDLGLPFKALELQGEVNDRLLFEVMYQENESRVSLSVYEQGQSFKSALDKGIYASKSEMADALGCSRTWLNVCLDAVELPERVIQCWANITEIKNTDVKALKEAIEKDREMVLLRAELILERDEPLKSKDVLKHLLFDDGVSVKKKPQSLRLRDDTKPFAKMSTTDAGDHVIKLDSAFTAEDLDAVLSAISKLAAKKPEFKQVEKPAAKAKAKA